MPPDPDSNATVSFTAPAGAGPSAAALAAESAGATGRGTWAKAIEPHASASIRNPKINFVIVFIMFFSVVRTNLSLAVTLREEGQVELQGETPKQLGAPRYCETCRNAVNIIFRREDTFLLSTRQRNTSFLCYNRVSV